MGQLNPEAMAFRAMLEGWACQQRARFLDGRETIEPRLALVRRMVAFTGLYRWQWTPTEKEAFDSAVEEAQFEYGHRGYTGSIAEKDRYTVISESVVAETSAEEYASRLMNRGDDRSDDKWGPADVIPVTPREDGRPRFLFFGFASCQLCSSSTGAGLQGPVPGGPRPDHRDRAQPTDDPHRWSGMSPLTLADPSRKARHVRRLSQCPARRPRHGSASRAGGSPPNGTTLLVPGTDWFALAHCPWPTTAFTLDATVLRSRDGKRRSAVAGPQPAARG
ncbi:hypothetical protein [Streptomyces spinosirectus]